jgi:hypothetical protein
MVKIDAAAAETPNSSMEIIMPRLYCGVDKVWIQHWNATNDATNDATIEFFVGWHEYLS